MRCGLIPILFSWSCMSVRANGPPTYMINTTYWNSQCPRYHSVSQIVLNVRKDTMQMLKKNTGQSRHGRDADGCITVLTYRQRGVQRHRKKALTLTIR